LTEIVLQSILYIGFCVICFTLFPVLAWKKTKDKLFVLVQSGLSAMWIGMLITFFTDIPTGESGFVIVGILFVLPIFCIATQLLFFAVYWIMTKIFKR
jgi:hypothetical protein